MLCTGMALMQPIAGSGGDIVVKIRLHCYPAAGQGFAHGSGPWAKQRIQQGRQPIRRKRCADRFKVQEQVRLIPKQRSCQQLVCLAQPLNGLGKFLHGSSKRYRIDSTVQHSME